MRFLVDEDVAIDVARALQHAGHQVLQVGEILGFQTDDVDIWHHAIRLEAVVVTCNRRDFLAIAGSAPETGLIILTAAGRDKLSAGTFSNCSLGRAKRAFGATLTLREGSNGMLHLKDHPSHGKLSFGMPRRAF